MLHCVCPVLAPLMCQWFECRLVNQSIEQTCLKPPTLKPPLCVCSMHNKSAVWRKNISTPSFPLPVQILPCLTNAKPRLKHQESNRAKNSNSSYMADKLTDSSAKMRGWRLTNVVIDIIFTTVLKVTHTTSHRKDAQ